jgi:DNA-binding NarL/FixJ family response regulator
MAIDHLIRILIVFHHRLFADTLEVALGQQDTMVIDGAVGDDDVSPLERILTVSPDIVLMEATIERISALQLIGEVRQQLPTAKLILIGLDQVAANILDFIEAGASGYVPKDASSKDLIQTIEAVNRGESPCPPSVAAKVLARIRQLSRGPFREQKSQTSLLTTRERDVLELLAAGFSNKEIATRLDIAVCTTKSHVHNILKKLGVESRKEAILRAYTETLLRNKRTARY